MRKLFFSGALLLALTATACGSNKSTESSADTTDSAAVAQTTSAAASASDAEYNVTDKGIVSANGRPMVVDFSAEWCPPCRRLKPIFADLKKEYAGKVDFVSIDVDSLEQLARQYRIENIPALVFINTDGKEVYRTVGFQDAAQIKSDVASYLE